MVAYVRGIVLFATAAVLAACARYHYVSETRPREAFPADDAACQIYVHNQIEADKAGGNTYAGLSYLHYYNLCMQAHGWNAVK